MKLILFRPNNALLTDFIKCPDAGEKSVSSMVSPGVSVRADHELEYPAGVYVVIIWNIKSIYVNRKPIFLLTSYNHL